MKNDEIKTFGYAKLPNGQVVWNITPLKGRKFSRRFLASKRSKKKRGDKK